MNSMPNHSNLPTDSFHRHSFGHSDAKVDYIWKEWAKHVDALFSTKIRENLVELNFVTKDFPIIVHLLDCTSIAKVLMNQQNEFHEYHYEIVELLVNKNKMYLM